jgi:O-antigen/teichoic acid export membrane protein
MGYAKTALAGMSWVALMRGMTRGLSVLRTIVLARLLTPEQFGIFGIAAVVLGIVEMITETGINVILIQDKNSNNLQSQINAAYSFSILRGIVISLIILISIPFVAAFFDAPQSAFIIGLIAIVPLLRGFINPSVVRIQKDLRFNVDFVFRSCLTIVDAVVAISLTWWLRTPEGLVLGLIASALTEIYISHRYLRPKPIFSWNNDKITNLIKRGKWMTGAGIFSYIATRTPEISIGKIMSVSNLGIYQMAYRFSVVFIDEIIEVFNRVSFPVFSKFEEERERLLHAYIKQSGVVLVMAVFIMTIVYISSDVIIPLLLGPQWESISNYTRLMVWLGLAIALTAPSNPVFLAVKKQSYLMVITLQMALFSLIFIPITTITHGLQGAIVAYALITLSTIPLRSYFLWKIFHR